MLRPMIGSQKQTARHRGRTALVAVAAGVGLFALLAVGMVGGRWGLQNDVRDWTLMAAAFAFLGSGGLILWKANGNRVGWLFVAVGLLIPLSSVAVILTEEQGLLAFSGLSSAFWLSWFGLVALMLMWFPTGAAVGPRWRWLDRSGVGLIGVLFLTSLTSQQFCPSGSGLEGGGCAEWIDNPLGIPGMPHPEYSWFGQIVTAAFVGLLVAGVVGLVVRYRRAGVVERLQLKWFLLACSAFAAGVVGEAIVEGVLGLTAPAAFEVWFWLATLAIPVSATLAILRYRLYDIDQIISRAVSYALVVGVLGLVFAAGVVWIPGLLGLADSPLLVAGTTLAVAGLFNPVRRRVQGRVERRFNRSRYDAQRVMDRFAGSLRDEVHPGGVIDGWIGVVSETMQPETVGVWVKER